MTDSQVIVLGSGIAGCLTACRLADDGYEVTLVDRHQEPMSAASRWNEGKIHLGFTYIGTPSTDTALLMLEGAAVFEDTIREISGSDLDDSWFTEPVIYLVDPGSQFPADLLWRRARAVGDALTHAAGKNLGLRRYVKNPPVSAMDPEKAGLTTGVGRIAAAWQTVERAIAPEPVARLIRDSVAARDITVVQAEVSSVTRHNSGWRVTTDKGPLTGSIMVNCTWESLPMIDSGILDRRLAVSIRYKYGLFGTGLSHFADLSPSTRILGPFGDITPYRNGEAYISWYPSALAGLSDNGIPPRPKQMDKDTLLEDSLAGLGLSRDLLEESQANWELGGGYVIARGKGDIDTADSPLHDRSRPGAYELAPGYVSVDTGKYSLGPLMALRAAELVNRCCPLRRTG